MTRSLLSLMLLPLALTLTACNTRTVTVTVPQRCPIPPQLPARLQKAVTVDGLDRLITDLNEPAESSQKNETKSQ